MELNIIQKLEYVGENLYLLFKYNHNLKDVKFNYKEIIVINFLKELLKCEDNVIINSLKQIILQECEKCYYNECKKYKYYENQESLKNNIKSSYTRFSDFIIFVENN